MYLPLIIINDDCLYITYKKSKEFQTPALNTKVIIASYITTHASLELYIYLGLGEGRTMYYDIDSILYRHVQGLCIPSLSQFSGGMTDELAGSYITHNVSNCEIYTYRTGDCKQVVNVK